MTKDILKRMLAAKGEICISIIMPTHDMSRERRNDKIEIKNTVKRAKEKLELYTDGEIYKPLVAKLDTLVGQIDFLHNKKGIGIFVSPSIAELISFPVNVEEKIVIGDSFEINEVAYLTSLEAEYAVLLLSEKKVRLLKGKMDQLVEVHNNDFPDHYEDTHEYSKPGRGSSFSPQNNLKGFEKDKSIIEDIRIQDYFRSVDKHLNGLLTADLPLFVVAPVEELAMFEEVSQHNKQVAGVIHGNHTKKKRIGIG
ncbi:MAG: hypothetical protein IPN29_13505 [Saprospiraceae bacterium]|nr:hypothetical protein [Saprospiraceae bacterium]